MDRFGQNMYNAESIIADNSGIADNINVDNSSIGDRNVSVEYDRYKQMYYKNTMPDSRVLAFAAGVCLGMVFFYLSGIKLMDGGHIPAALSSENISKLSDFDFSAAGLFEYTAFKRLGQLIFLFICTTSFMKDALSYAFLGWGGFELGIVVFGLSHQYGFKGAILGVMLFIPHGIFFLISFILLFGKNIRGYTKDYHKYRSIMESGLHNKITKIKKTSVILSLWLLGILSEVYINPGIIKMMAIFFK